MKILIVNFSDTQGGAAIAAKRLHDGLLEKGVNSQMLVQLKHTDDYTIIGPTSIIDKIKIKYFEFRNQLKLRKYEKTGPFSPNLYSTQSILTRIHQLNPDIVHLHWINAGMLSLKHLSQIKKPIVWSLHDNWAFTGGCHIALDCVNYNKTCGSCPVISSKNKNDLSNIIWKKKKKYYSKTTNFTIVGLSKWITRKSKESTLLGSKSHVNLPNLIDTSVFKPMDKNYARSLWNLPLNKKLILFGANNALNDTNKGYAILTNVINSLKNNMDIELVVFGGSKPKKEHNFIFKTHYLGKLQDEISLVTLYNAVNVVVIPSFQENLSNVIMESMACAVPVVGFNVGGNSDLIDHKINGYLATPFNEIDFKNGITWVLENKDYNALQKEAKSKIDNAFNKELVTRKYIDLYKSILNKDV